MEMKCGCWAVLRRSVRGACNSSDPKNSANSIPRTSLVYDAGNKTWFLASMISLNFGLIMFPVSFFLLSSMVELNNSKLFQILAIRKVTVFLFSFTSYNLISCFALNMFSAKDHLVYSFLSLSPSLSDTIQLTVFLTSTYTHIKTHSIVISN